MRLTSRISVLRKCAVWVAAVVKILVVAARRWSLANGGGLPRTAGNPSNKYLYRRYCVNIDGREVE